MLCRVSSVATVRMTDTARFSMSNTTTGRSPCGASDAAAKNPAGSLGSLGSTGGGGIDSVTDPPPLQAAVFHGGPFEPSIGRIAVSSMKPCGQGCDVAELPRQAVEIEHRRQH